MDISLLKTFLVLARTRHFGHTADHMCITQSTVSARIKLLENHLDVQLFHRKRNDLQLTAAGTRLQKHAETIVKAWEIARQDTINADSFSDSLALGYPSDIWSIFLRNWTLSYNQTQPEILLTLEQLASDILIQRTLQGSLDLAFLYEPPQIPELDHCEIFKTQLLLVATHPDQSIYGAMQEGYILVDWGNAFKVAHAERIAHPPSPVLRVNSAAMALDWLLAKGGSAYLPQALIAPHLKNQTLYPVKDAPILERPAYALWRSGAQNRKPIAHALSLCGCHHAHNHLTLPPEDQGQEQGTS